MAAFCELPFFLAVMERQLARLQMPALSEAERDDFGTWFHKGWLTQPLPTFSRGEHLVGSDPWVIAVMAVDTRRMIVAASAGDDSATVAHDDLIALGWRPELVRRFGAVALAAALASIKAEANVRHQRQFSGFNAALAAVVAVLCFGIGVAAVGVASLI
jgi:hypothetical protein